MFVGVEAGGTKVLVGAGTGPANLSPLVRIPTTDPSTTLANVVATVTQVVGEATVTAVGVATFGPVDLRPSSAHYGHLVGTPKPGWDGANMVGPLRAALDVPIALDTDVNGAALGESRWGVGRDCDPLVYVTVGTGIGGGAIINGSPVHGLLHPEMGHMIVRRHRDDDFPGCCPFHGDCVEGLASGPAIQARQATSSSDDERTMLAIVSWYVGQLLTNLILAMSPQRIVLGGGVMGMPGLLGAVRDRVRQLLDGYLRAPEVSERTHDYVVGPGLGDRAGVLGAIALAERAAST